MNGQTRDVLFENWWETLSKLPCPVCGKQDVELYEVTPWQNSYCCQSTGKEVVLKVTTSWEVASE